MPEKVRLATVVLAAIAACLVFRIAPASADAASDLSPNPSQAAAQLKTIEGLPLDSWPAPLVKYYIGEASEAAVQAAADSDPKATTSGCEIAFFIGESHLAAGRKEEAKSRLQRATVLCLKNSGERLVAVAELGRL